MGAVATLPAGLAVAAMPLPTTTCGTTVTASGQNISFSGGAIPTMPGCTITVPVTPTVAGSYSINFAAGALTTSKGTNAAAATTALTATNSPTTTAAFAPSTVLTNTNSTLTLTLSNPNPTPAFMPLGGVVTMPVGLVIASLTDTCGASASIIVSTTITIDLGMSGSIPAMGSCTITVQAQSNIAGAYTVTVNPGNLVTALGNNVNTSTATLMVTNPAPAVTLSVPSIAFGSRTVNTTSPATVVTISNSGTANLVISGMATTGEFPFTTTCPILTPPLAPLANCTASIFYAPLTVGPVAGMLNINSNAPGSPHVINLTGTGAPVAVPAIAVASSNIVFGGAVVGTIAPQQTIIVSNPGTATLNLTSITVSGGVFSRVTPVSTNPPNCSASLAPTGSCQIAVTCNPASVGTFTGQVSIVHNATGSPTNVALACTGNALPVATVVLRAPINFGDQVLNTASAAQTVNIANSGTATMTVSAISLSGPHANNFAVSGTCSSVAPGASCPVLVTFNPTATGTRTASLGVATDAQNAAAVNSVALSGNGVLAPRPVAALSLTSVGYGNSIFGGASSVQTIVLKNEGGLPLSITSIAATGDFAVGHNCGSTVASLASCTINAYFTPLGVGVRGGELLVFSDAQGSPHKVQLSGTGCRWFSQTGNRFFLTSC
ncbi:MAG: choice-of-anchor D domain-containing protein [Betaproteobacteria bacterium]|nr:choice-of-anchor D domain-containing protein [Betaproteobacteria bacterium]